MRALHSTLIGSGVVGSALAAGLAVLLSASPTLAREAFDHETHDGQFDSCRTCHDPGGQGMYIVGPDDCAKCHNGSDLDRVDWTPPMREPSLVRFDHSTHPYAVNDPSEELECSNCHSPSSGASAMNVVLPTPETCLDCHNGSPEPHWAPGEVSCGDCHMPLTAAKAVSAERIADFPQPESHSIDDFIWQHGAQAMSATEACAVCHARNDCERCHANGDQVAAIASLERDDRVASLVAGREGKWPTPPDHESGSWWAEHGTAADDSPERCATCHDANSCAGCHQQGFARLEVLPKHGKRGMPVLPLRPLDHTPMFAQEHGPMALAGDCAVCHDEGGFCADCHDGQMGGGYHPPSFVLHHAASAAGPDPACTNCHSTEVFCRSCHMERGLASKTRSDANGYHDSAPYWLLNHGAAARQGLDECSSCHQQDDCLQCHSARSGWRVNPHGPDFDAMAVAEANEAMCITCHPASFMRQFR